MSTNETRPLDLDLVPAKELKEHDLETVSAGLNKVGSFIPNFPVLSFPSINIPSFGT